MKKTIDPLPPIDHSEIDYERFEKNFYVEHQEIQHLSPFEVESLRRKLGLRVSGYASGIRLVIRLVHGVVNQDPRDRNMGGSVRLSVCHSGTFLEFLRIYNLVGHFVYPSVITSR